MSTNEIILLEGDSRRNESLDGNGFSAPICCDIRNGLDRMECRAPLRHTGWPERSYRYLRITRL